MLMLLLSGQICIRYKRIFKKKNLLLFGWKYYTSFLIELTQKLKKKDNTDDGVEEEKSSNSLPPPPEYNQRRFNLGSTAGDLQTIILWCCYYVKVFLRSVQRLNKTNLPPPQKKLKKTFQMNAAQCDFFLLVHKSLICRCERNPSALDISHH